MIALAQTKKWPLPRRGQRPSRSEGNRGPYRRRVSLHGPAL